MDYISDHNEVRTLKNSLLHKAMKKLAKTVRINFFRTLETN